ncbi:molybdopterin-dependent oxidoreductase [Streptomyces sp. NPDC060194]|uniref:molybdopterin-dependent oxidoreductase n=1 Tax=Streptomyces sp. NPDC060194 TaxID=3347069 RepID=UPI00365A00C5
MTGNRTTPSRGARVLRGCLGALSGLIAAFAALCTAELAAGAVRPEAGPVTAIGGAVIDRTPAPVKDFAIRNFGTNDKLVLQLGILALLAAFAMLIGLLALRHRKAGAAAALVFGAVGAVAALSRPESRASDVVPSVVGGLVAAGVLYVLAGFLTSRPRSSSASAGADGRGERGADAGEERGTGVGATRAAADEGPTGPAEAAPASTTDETAPRTSPAPQEATGAPTLYLGDGPSPGGFNRRGFVIAATAAVAASAGAGALGRKLAGSGAAEARATRGSVRIPAPRSTARPIPKGADLGIRDVASFTTANRDFYRVDTALVVPRVNADTWRLRIHGKGVQNELELSFQDLLGRELVERDITMTCVSNEVGGPYVGNARWIGVRLADVLREAGVRAPSEGGPADQLVSRSVDGMTIGTPVETVLDGRDALLALGMNGEPLPFDHGFPVRMIVPGLYGYVSACKWIKDIDLTNFDDYDAYWVRRKWSREAPIKTMSRIDTPRPLSSQKAGTVPVAGVAWAQHRGIARVEVRVDEGPWQQARLGDEAGIDTWRQWVWEWPATPGRHRLEVRATDRTGETQTDERVDTVPDGATGWHSVVVTVP